MAHKRSNEVDKSFSCCRDEYFNSLPVGYRFAPHDDELIIHFLLGKVTNKPLPVNRIHEVEFYKYSPQELTGKYKLLRNRETEWYFFTQRNKKHPNGCRPSRTAGQGFWKLTGADKAIPNKKSPIGVRKSLDYYDCTKSSRTKTSWKMHEYVLSERLLPSAAAASSSRDIKLKQLDEWVLCKVYNIKSERYQYENKEIEVPGTSVNLDTETYENKETEVGGTTVTSDTDLDFPAAVYNHSSMISNQNQNGYGSEFAPLLPPGPSSQLNHLNSYLPPLVPAEPEPEPDPFSQFNHLDNNLDPLPTTFSDDFAHYAVPIQVCIPSYYDYGLEPIKDEDYYNGCMEMASMNHHLVLAAEQPLLPLPGYDYGTNNSELDMQPTIANTVVETGDRDSVPTAEEQEEEMKSLPWNIMDNFW